MADKKAPVKLAGADFTQIYIAVFVIVVTLILFALYKRRKSAKRGILLTGLCDSGKTLIYSQLLHNKNVQTHTSIKENIGTYIVNNDALNIVDIPGHERLRNKFFEQYKSMAKSVVFVLDSVTLQQNIRDVAEFLYDILVDPVISSGCSDMLILCNKQDQPFAKGATAVKSILEKELNMLRITKSKQLDSVDPKVKRASVLGNASEDFDFAALPVKVDIAESYAWHKDGSVDIEGLKKWLARF
ncbi:hypothetical protein NQ315_011706 [Exocentrus adspersus]|uniref:Signal recognition particle receptor subunit beta n=1 Tax=Exocentrus adspersus TaxID=1586481 RepID=A0AAV8W0A7_9CUCU|nr:hypothetical protein NQ315_011706 [Exocentrus adspersus]